MHAQPYIVYPHTAHPVEAGQLGAVVNRCYINEPGQVSFGVIDYVPGWFIPIHHHRTWELIIIGQDSASPGYTFFTGQWWQADPGSGIFFPQDCPHAWSAGPVGGFQMLWIYGGAHEEAGRLYDGDPQAFQPITSEEAHAARAWTPEA